MRRVRTDSRPSLYPVFGLYELNLYEFALSRFRTLQPRSGHLVNNTLCMRRMKENAKHSREATYESKHSWVASRDGSLFGQRYISNLPKWLAVSSISTSISSKHITLILIRRYYEVRLEARFYEWRAVFDKFVIISSYASYCTQENQFASTYFAWINLTWSLASILLS